MKLETLKESGLSRVTSKMDGHAIGMITAFRKDFTSAENMQRNKLLRAKLSHAGLHVTPVNGHYIENLGTEAQANVKEKSFFVVNPKKGDDNGELEGILMRLGAEFEQDSIFSKRFGAGGRVIGTTDRPNADPARGDGFDVPKYLPGHEGEYMTKVKGRPFKFESLEETILPPNHGAGWWPLSILAKQDWRDVRLTEADEKSLEE